MSRFLLLIALAALGGCATTSSDYYRDGRYYGSTEYHDGYYDDGYVDRGYYRDGYYDGGYGGGDYYYGDYSGGGYYASDYLMWPEYYSIFWPINHWYADPYYYPGYYYGVTYFPRDYWSLSLTWSNSYRYGWGYSYGSYWNYSPYRYSWADNYYDWYPWHQQHSYHRDRHQERPRYGSARNEAERVMALRQHERGQLGSAAYRHSGVRSSSPDRRGPRGAYYPSQQTSAAAGVNRSARSASVDRNRVARDELVRNAQYRRASTGKPEPGRVSDRTVDPAWQLERGAGSRAKPAIGQTSNPNASSMADAAQDVRQYRRKYPDPEQSAPARVRYSSSVRRADVQTRQVEPVRAPATRSMRSSRSVTSPDRAYRSPPQPVTRESAASTRQSSYRALPRAETNARYSAPTVNTRGYSPDTSSRYQRQAPAPSRASSSGYRAPPVVRSQPSAPASRSSSSSESKPATSGKSSRRSSSSRVRAARDSRSGDD